MGQRTIAIGDIHGCDAALASLLEAIRPTATDTIVQLGDFIDRGPDSRSVIERLIDLGATSQLIVLRGDHEQLMLDAYSDPQRLSRWLQNGGSQTLASYDCDPVSWRSSMPSEHVEFILATRRFYENDDHIFVHAGYESDVAMEAQSNLALFWMVSHSDTCQPHQSGKSAVVGHTAQRSGEILDLGFLRCIDTDCYRGGWLTALDVQTGSIWQVDRFGILREP